MPETSAPHSFPRTVIVMGVSGSGKSLVGSLLAKQLGGVFEDADDFHPASNKAKMSAGTPLTDADRWPWFDILRARIDTMRDQTPCYVLACSALKAIYRDRLRAGEPDQTLTFLLMRGSRQLIEERMSARKGHFMPVALLDSQFATLEDTPDLHAVSIDQTPEEIVEDMVQTLAALTRS